MRKLVANDSIVIYIINIIILIIFDYINLPSILGIDMLSINWNLCSIILNKAIVIMLYVITYKTLNERTIEREKNKNEISSLLIKECYRECKNYVEFLNQKTVEEYIVPKIDFNSTDNKIISNLKNSPFVNENIIMDLVKDGQITKKQIEKYLKIKQIFNQYITMRITFFDKSDFYEPLEKQLYSEINIEIKNLT